MRDTGLVIARYSSRLLSASLVVLLILYWWPWPTFIGSVLGVFVAWVFVAAWGSALLAIALQERIAGIASGLAVCFHIWVLMPGPSPSANPTGPTVTIASINLLMVHPDPAILIEVIRDIDADVLALQEFSPRWERAFREGGLNEIYDGPRVTREDSFGIALLSKTPLAHADTVDLQGVDALSGVLRIAGQDVHLLNVHTLPPRNTEYHQVWLRQLSQLEEFASQDNDLVMLGDFNASPSSRELRALLSAGLHSAHDQVGRPWAHTFPNGLFPLPPVRLDHALLSRRVVAHSVFEVHNTGSDHSVVVYELSLAQ